MGKIYLDLQIAEDLIENSPSNKFYTPKQSLIKEWLEVSLVLHNEYQLKINSEKKIQKDHEISIRIVDEKESAKLNSQYRQKDLPTNVLSFPSDLPDYIQSPLLGDLVICSPVVKREAKEQEKILEQHWAHMIIHGLLHLLGYDHIDDSDAEVMETLEINILHKLKIANPY